MGDPYPSLMNDTQANKLEMFLIVRTTCERHESAWSGMPIFADTFKNYGKALDRIQDLLESREALGSAAENKARARQEMAEKAFSLAAGLRAYGAISGKRELLSNVDFTRTDFLFGRDEATLTRANIVMDAVKEHLAALAPYSIIDKDLWNLRKAIEAYEKLLHAPEANRAARAGMTQQLATAFDKADEILKERLDNLVAIFADSQPGFVQAYEKARVIKDRTGPAREPGDEAEPPAEDNTGSATTPPTGSI